MYFLRPKSMMVHFHTGLWGKQENKAQDPHWHWHTHRHWLSSCPTDTTLYINVRFLHYYYLCTLHIFFILYTRNIWTSLCQYFAHVHCTTNFIFKTYFTYYICIAHTYFYCKFFYFVFMILDFCTTSFSRYLIPHWKKKEKVFGFEQCLAALRVFVESYQWFVITYLACEPPGDVCLPSSWSLHKSQDNENINF